jgi:hypothetical protein
VSLLVPVLTLKENEMATTDNEQKTSPCVNQHKRMAMGGNVNGKTLPSAPAKTSKTPA